MHSMLRVLVLSLLLGACTDGERDAGGADASDGSADAAAGREGDLAKDASLDGALAPDADSPDVGEQDGALAPDADSSDVGEQDGALAPDADSPDVGEQDGALAPDVDSSDVGEQDGALSRDADSPDVGELDGSVQADAAAADGGDAGAPIPLCGTVAASGNDLIDLGHTTPLLSLSISEQRVASQGSDGRWILWNAATGARVAQGSTGCTTRCSYSRTAQLRANLFVTPTPTQLELRDPSDGHVLRAVDAAGSFGVATDGSYIWHVSTSTLTIWSAAGEQITTRSGNYSGVSTYAHPSALRIASSGTSIESIALPSGVSSTVTFTGTFHAWWGNGERFITTSGTTARIYAASGAQQRIVSVPSLSNVVTRLGGSADYFVENTQDQARVSSLAAPDTPLLTVLHLGANLYTTSTSATFVGREPAMAIVDTRGTVPVQIDVTIPSAYLGPLASDSTGNWAIADETGVVYVKLAGAPLRSLGCGQVQSMSLSPSGTWAIATAANQILVGSTAEPRSASVIPFRAGRIALSNDGQRLLAHGDKHEDYYQSDDRFLSDRSLMVFELPSGALQRSISSSIWMRPYIYDAVLAPAGDRLAHNWFQAGSSCLVKLTNIAGTTTFPIAATHTCRRLLLAPDGVHLAVPQYDDVLPLYPQGLPTVNIYEDGVLVGAVDGFPVVWLDNERLLIEKYERDIPNRYLFSESVIVDVTGAELARAPALDWSDFTKPDTGFPSEPATTALHGGTQVHAGRSIIDVSSGAKVWPTDGSNDISAVNETHALVMRDNRILLVTHP